MGERAGHDDDMSAARPTRFEKLAASGRLRRPVTRIVVVVAGPNPSFDYYLAPRLTGGLPVEIVQVDERIENARERLAGAFVIFCRYMSARWLAAIEDNVADISGVGLFLDDDVDALAADRTVPLLYRWRLRRLHLDLRARLNRLCDLVFVSNHALARRYAAAQPYILPPLAGDTDAPVAADQSRPFRICFHSTSVHDAEHSWLRPVMREILRSEPNVTCDVAASVPQSWWWHTVPRAQVGPSMRWPQYHRWSRERGADLLLAPLIPTPGNLCRSWTKRIDAMRLGASILVSAPEVYLPSAAESDLGMCVPLQRDAWLAAIRSLVHDRTKTARLRDLNRSFVEDASVKAASSLSALLQDR